MNYFIVDFNTKGAWESFIALESGDGPVIADKLLSYLVKLKCSNTWLDPLGDFAKCLSNQLISLTHQFYFFVCLQKYHSVIINKQLPILCDP